MLFPFGTQLVKLSRRLVRSDEEEQSLLCEVGVDRYGGVGASAVIVTSFERAIDYMTKMVTDNLNLSLDALLCHDEKRRDELYEREQRINECRYEVNEYMNRTSSLELTEHDAELVISYFKITTDLERLGDHAKNLMGYVREVALNEEALQELARLQELFKEAVGSLYRRDETIGNEYAHMEEIERQVDALTQEYQDEQLHRLKEHKCSAAQCVVYVNVLVDMERIFDHLMNIVEECRDHHYHLLVYETAPLQTA